MNDNLGAQEFQLWFSKLTNFPANRFHPLVWIVGEPDIGEGVYIGGLSEVNAKGASVKIGDYCDIASFVTINCADSHKKCIGLSEEVDRKDILIEDHVFIGSHSVIKGGARIGHHSVVAAGSIVGAVDVPPYSLVVGNPALVKPAYYLNMLNSGHDSP
jgi:acetyltransferase-like isoleucine patch superfamily enzyme